VTPERNGRNALGKVGRSVPGPGPWPLGATLTLRPEMSVEQGTEVINVREKRAMHLPRVQTLKKKHLMSGWQTGSRPAGQEIEGKDEPGYSSDATAKVEEGKEGNRNPGEH